MPTQLEVPIDALTFDLASDICLAAQNGGLNIDDVPLAKADSLGPLAELRHICPELISSSDWLVTGIYSTILTKLLQFPPAWYEPSMGWQGFVTANKLSSDPLAWPDFMIRAKRAAKSVGFSDDHAAKLAAAIGEIYDNILEHSQNSGSGYVVFFAKERSFEFVVADSGIGVLASLRGNPKFSSLSDSGRALELALNPGVSRFGIPGRGSGFQPVIVGLANISHLVRFRSDDHCRELVNSNHEISAVTRQDASLHGFLCSVYCKI